MVDVADRTRVTISTEGHSVTIPSNAIAVLSEAAERLRSGEALDPEGDDRERLETLTELKRLILGNASNGPTYRVEFEIEIRCATPLALMTMGGAPVELHWWSDALPDDEIVLSVAAAWVPSRIGPDPDGNPRFVAKFVLPALDIPKGIGSLAAAMYNAADAKQHPRGKLLIISQQENLGL